MIRLDNIYIKLTLTFIFPSVFDFIRYKISLYLQHVYTLFKMTSKLTAFCDYYILSYTVPLKSINTSE